jgi:zinc D-Ala-D-Ala carboxypeptidase
LTDLSPHFSSSEFVDRREDVRRDPPCSLLCVLEALRLKAGVPIRIVSGFRTPATNTLVGGASDSRHLYGDAADIPAGLATREDAEAAGATGIGLTGEWVTHVDVRPGPVVHWHY